MVFNERRWAFADRVGLYVACVLLAVQGIVAVGYCWRYPVMDELSNFAPGGLERHLTAGYLLSFQNEHAILLTRLLTWTMLRTVDGNPVVQTACNYLIFLGACWMVRQLLKQLKVPGTDILLCSAALPTAAEVHNWAFQTHFFATFAVYLGALWALSRRDALVHLAGPLGLLGCLSFSAGIPFACSLIAIAACLAIWQPARRWAYLGAAGGSLAGLVAYFALWPGHLEGHPPMAKPWSLPFWDFIAIHLGGSLGWSKDMAQGVGWALLAIVVLTLVPFALRTWRDRSVPQLIALGLMAGILGSLALTSLGRAGSELNANVSGRYTAYTLFFALVLWAMHGVLFAGKQRYLAGLALVFLAQMAPNFQYKRPYRQGYEHNLDAQRCARAYYLGENEGDCPDVLPWRSAAYLDRMWQADVFAVRELKRLNPGVHWRYDVHDLHAAPQS